VELLSRVSKLPKVNCVVPASSLLSYVLASYIEILHPLETIENYEEIIPEITLGDGHKVLAIFCFIFSRAFFSYIPMFGSHTLFIFW